MKNLIATAFVSLVAVLAASPVMEAAARFGCCCTGCTGCAAGCC